MTVKERERFRRSSKWKSFRYKCRLHTSIDYITKQPLLRGWNLHHLDLNIMRYAQLDDPNRFMPLNKKTHEIVHEVFKWYKKDKKSIDRLKETLEKMWKYTNEEVSDGNSHKGLVR